MSAITKEYLQEFKREKQIELQNVNDTLWPVFNKEINEKVEIYKNQLVETAAAKVENVKESLNGEIKAIDRIIEKFDEKPAQ